MEIDTALAVTQKNGTLVGAGNEPYIIGAAFALKKEETSDFFEGNNGVYVLEVIDKKNANTA